MSGQDHFHQAPYKCDLKKNPSTPKCGNTVWFVWHVDGFGIEESDERAAEAIDAGETVTIISGVDAGKARPQDTGSGRDE